MKEFLVKYQYILPFTAGVLLAGIGLYYMIFETTKIEIGGALVIGALLNFYLGLKMKPKKED